MHGEKINLQDVLDSNICFDIPPYQRTYEWTAAEWRRLFADVLAQAAPVPSGGAAKPAHFMGTILTESEEDGVKRSVRSLVDGQQRFVTLALLAAAVRHRRAELKGRDAKVGDVAWFSHERQPGTKAPDARLRIITQKSDLDDFTAALGGHWRDVVEARMTTASSIWQAYSYFRFLLALGQDADPLVLTENSKALDKLPLIPVGQFDRTLVEAQWIEKLESIETRNPGAGLPPGPRQQWDLKALESAARKKLFFYNLMRDAGDEDTSVIFETINASGRGLLALDLVKNSIFMRLGGGSPRDAVFEKYWSPAENMLSRTRWPKKRAPYQEVFLYDYLIASGEQRHQGSLSQSRGYGHFLRRVDRQVPRSGTNYERRLEKFLKLEFFPSAAVWPVAVGAETSVTYEGNTRIVPAAACDRVESLMAVSAGPPVPMVMLALVHWLRNDPGWTDAALCQALATVDSFVMRSAVCLTGISNLRSQFMVICGNLNGFSGGLTPAKFKAALKGMETDAAVASAMKDLPLYQKMKSDAILAVFRGIEAQLTTFGGPHQIKAADYSVEHVLPQKPGSWARDIAKWGLTARQAGELNDRLHRIGNLTPITKPHNSSLRNKPYEQKKVGIRKHAAGLKVHGSVTRSRSWTATQIDARAKHLAAAFVKRWPKA